MIYTPLIWPLLIAAAILAGIALYVRRFRDAPAVPAFMLLMWLAAAWAFLDALGISTVSLPLRIVWFQIHFLPIVLLQPMVLVFALEYTGQAQRLSRRRLSLLFVVPITALLLSWTSGYHTFFRYDFRLDMSGPVPVLLMAKGPGFWVYVAYQTSIALVAFGLLIASFRFHTLHFRNTLAILVGILVPLATDLLYIFGVSPIPGFDFAPTTFILTGLLAIWALLRFRLFDVGLIARNTVMESIDDLVIVLDMHGYIADFNRAAQAACGLSPSSVGAKPDTLPPDWADLMRRFLDRYAHEEVTVGAGEHQHCYDLIVSPIQDERTTSGRLFLLHDITERKRAEQAQRESDARYRQLIESLPDGVVLHRDNKIILANRSGLRLMGALALEQVIGRSILDFVHPDSVAAAIERLQKVVIEQEPTPLIQQKFVRLDGQTIDVEVTSRSIQMDGTSATVSVFRDISERKQTEAAMLQVKEAAETANAELRKLSRAIEQSANMVMITDLDGRIEYVNPKFEAVTGYASVEVLGQNPRILKSGQQDHVFYKHLWDTIKSGKEWRGELCNKRKEGTLYWERASIAPVYDATGQMTHFVAVKEDVTELKLIEEAEREQRALADALRDVAAVLTSTLDFHAVLDRIMQEMHRVVAGDAVAIYMIEGDQAQALRWYVHGQPDYHELNYLSLSTSTTFNLRQMTTTGEPLVIPDTYVEPRWIRLPGTEWISSYAGAPLRVRGQVIGFVEVDSATAGLFTARDGERLRAFADQAAVAIQNAQLFDETHRRAEHMTTLNRIGLAITSGLDLDHVLKSLYEQCQQVVAADSFYVALYDRGKGLIRFPLFLDEGERVQVPTYDIGTRRGPTDYVIATRRTLYLPDTLAPDAESAFQIVQASELPSRSYVGVPLVMHDQVIGVFSAQSYQAHAYSPDQIRLLETIATQAAVAVENARLYMEAREAKEAIEAANTELLTRNQELDAFAHTVAHDLKTPVGLLLGHAELLADMHDDLPLQQIHDSARVIARSAAKLDNIIEELMLLTGVRKQEAKTESLDMGEIIHEAMRRLDHLIQESKAQIIYPDISTWPKALGYAPWVEEVWINYLSNAIKYGHTRAAIPHIELGARLAPSAGSGDQVCFWVRDNGVGLTPEQQSRLFAPFERLEQTRAGGYGLGLSIVRRIVERLGGQVGVESQLGQGSTFYFTLPAAAVKAD